MRPLKSLCLPVLLTALSLSLVEGQTKQNEPNTNESIETLRVKAEQGDAQAQYELGLRAEIDSLQATWFGRSAQQGHAGAQLLLCSWA